MKNKIITIRREIHKNPELQFEEFNTASLVCGFLKELGLNPKTQIAKTGVVADICGNKSGKTILLRADMDALQLTEQTGLDYASEREGVMHACGHDFHVATLLYCASVLIKNKDSLGGRVRLLFQPAEEGEGGAQPMIDEGVLQGVDAAFAFHISNEVPLGAVKIKEGGFMASPDHFFITINGKGGHGARPELCHNPIDAGSDLCLRLKEIKCDDSFVVSIGSFVSGTNENIIPDSALLKGTARTHSKETRTYIYNEIKRCIKEVEEKYSVKIELDYHFLYPPLVNHSGLTREFIKTAQNVLGEENVVIQDKPDMIGEDFAFFAERVPACMAKLGGAHAPLHTTSFTADEESVFVGGKLMAQFAMDYLAGDK